MSPLTMDSIDQLSRGSSPADTSRPDKKRPGRKPNPASPAVRKAQNRAAQRAFRERKEKHIAELEVARKELAEERDSLKAENEQLRARVGILGHESWHLKGALMTLQLACLVNRVDIPLHSPYIRKETLIKLEHRFPEIVSSYQELLENHNPLPSGEAKTPSETTSSAKTNDCRMSTHTIVVAKDGIHALPCGSVVKNTTNVESSSPSASKSITGCHTTPSAPTTVTKEVTLTTRYRKPEYTSAISHKAGSQAGNISAENTTPTSDNATMLPTPAFSPEPIMLTKEPFPVYNLQAFQTVSLRSHLKMCIEMGSAAFVIEPTVLQLTIPHDPRIDLIPVSAMRDRMILFRHMFDLDECLRCFLEKSRYNGGDPTMSDSWVIPVEFYKRFWFLCIDYDRPSLSGRWSPGERNSSGSPETSLSAIVVAHDADAQHELPQSVLAPLLAQERSLTMPVDSPNFDHSDMLDHSSSVFLNHDQIPAFSVTNSSYSHSDMDDTASLVLSPKDDKEMNWDKEIGNDDVFDILMDGLLYTSE